MCNSTGFCHLQRTQDCKQHPPSFSLTWRFTTRPSTWKNADIFYKRINMKITKKSANNLTLSSKRSCSWRWNHYWTSWISQSKFTHSRISCTSLNKIRERYLNTKKSWISMHYRPKTSGYHSVKKKLWNMCRCRCLTSRGWRPWSRSNQASNAKSFHLWWPNSCSKWSKLKHLIEFTSKRKLKNWTSPSVWRLTRSWRQKSGPAFQDL